MIAADAMDSTSIAQENSSRSATDDATLDTLFFPSRSYRGICGCACCFYPCCTCNKVAESFVQLGELMERGCR